MLNRQVMQPLLPKLRVSKGTTELSDRTNPGCGLGVEIFKQISTFLYFPAVLVLVTSVGPVVGFLLAAACTAVPQPGSPPGQYMSFTETLSICHFFYKSILAGQKYLMIFPVSRTPRSTQSFHLYQHAKRQGMGPSPLHLQLNLER